jgi:hypothetical protein
MVLILSVWAVNTATPAQARSPRCLFDLSIEELMEMRIDGDWQVDGRILSGDASPCEALSTGYWRASPGTLVDPGLAPNAVTEANELEFIQQIPHVR